MKCFDKMSSQSMFLRSRFELDFRTLGQQDASLYQLCRLRCLPSKDRLAALTFSRTTGNRRSSQWSLFVSFFSLRAIVLPDLPDVFLVNQCTRETRVQNVQNVQNAENVQNVLKYVYKTYTWSTGQEQENGNTSRSTRNACTRRPQAWGGGQLVRSTSCALLRTLHTQKFSWM